MTFKEELFKLREEQKVTNSIVLSKILDELFEALKEKLTKAVQEQPHVYQFCFGLDDLFNKYTDKYVDDIKRFGLNNDEKKELLLGLALEFKLLGFKVKPIKNETYLKSVDTYELIIDLNFWE